MKSIVRAACLLYFLVCCSSSALAAVKKGPYLLFEGANTSMTVLWQTAASERNTIRWGTDASYSMGHDEVGVYGAAFQHQYTITGLQPGTTYFYEVSSGASTYGAGSFRTAPAATATTVKLFAYGDSRGGPAEHEEVVGRLRAAYAAAPDFQSVTLHAGDWVTGDSEASWSSDWFLSGSSYPQLHALQAEMPIIGARGNHEGAGALYRKYFPEPYNAEFYWSFDYGPLHVTVIDQYTPYTKDSRQYAWIANDLAASAKPWKIVLLHEPGWSAGGRHGNNIFVQSVLQPLFKKFGVQLVIGGHNHYYARAVVDNIQHLTLGGGGAPLYDPVSDHPAVVKTDKSHHYVEIDIAGNSMTFTARRSDGTVIESIKIVNSRSRQAGNSDQ